jgi:F0F1-type ATP synthase alpha subunit
VERDLEGDLFTRLRHKLSLSETVGYTISVSDGIVKAIGLKALAYGEVVQFPGTDVIGLTCNLNKNSVDILILGDERAISSGSLVIGTGSGIKVPVSISLLGRVVNALGETIDGGLSPVSIKYNADINIKAPGIIFRERVSQPVFTGIKVIDCLIPVGKGQRELIIGDKGTGKTSICYDTILNQKSENIKNEVDQTFCVYVSVGQKRSSIK